MSRMSGPERPSGLSCIFEALVHSSSSPSLTLDNVTCHVHVPSMGGRGERHVCTTYLQCDEAMCDFKPIHLWMFTCARGRQQSCVHMYNCTV